MFFYFLKNDGDAMKNKGILSFFMAVFVFLSIVMPASADDDIAKKLPRFATLGKDEVFVRTGPALQYPIKWVYKKRGLPIEIIREYETWRQVRDIDGTDGWVHHAMLSGYRNGIIQSKQDVTLLKKADVAAAPVVRLEPGVLVTLDSCDPVWCRVGVSGFKGWTLRSNLWGVDASEQIE